MFLSVIIQNVERVRNEENLSIIPFHISDEEISKEARYYHSRMHWIDAITPPMESKLKSTAILPNYNFICFFTGWEVQERRNLPNDMP